MRFQALLDSLNEPNAVAVEFGMTDFEGFNRKASASTFVNWSPGAAFPCMRRGLWTPIRSPHPLAGGSQREIDATRFLTGPDQFTPA